MGREPHQDQPEQPHTPAPFATQDIGLASFLVLLGHDLSRLDDRQPTLMSFVFESVAPAEVEQYRLGQAVPAVEFVTMQRRLFALVRRRQAETARLTARPLIRTATQPPTLSIGRRKVPA